MEWRVEFSKAAERDLAALDRPGRRGVIERLEWFAGHFEHITLLPLHADWKGFFKLRAGN